MAKGERSRPRSQRAVKGKHQEAHELSNVSETVLKENKPEVEKSQGKNFPLDKSSADPWPKGFGPL